MNRYQLEVAELDRRWQLKIRAFTFVGVIVLTILALWSAGLPLTDWMHRFDVWLSRFTDETPKHVQSQGPAPLPTPIMTSPASSATALAGTDASVSEEPRALLLISTLPGRSSFEGTANIGTDATNPQTFTAGALLANGARLIEIHKTHVILQRGDKKARLDLLGPGGHASSVGNELLVVGGRVESAPLMKPSHEFLTDYIRPTPVFDGELIRGYEVYAGQNAGVFNQLGLQAGDVIIALNDSPFVDPSQAMDLFRQITLGMSVVATIERKGKRERVSLDGSLITADQERKKQAQAGIDAVPMMMPPV